VNSIIDVTSLFDRLLDLTFLVTHLIVAILDDEPSHYILWVQYLFYTVSCLYSYRKGKNTFI
jgi:hypothetical protein